MKIFDKEPNFRFMSKAFYAFLLSGLIIAAGLVLFFTKGFNMGIDFVGGSLVEVSFKDKVTIDELRKSLGELGLGDAEIVRVAKENKFFIKAVLKTADTTGKNDFAEHEKKVNLIKEAMMTAEEKTHFKSEKVDLNNSGDSAIIDALTSRGISQEDAQEAAQQILDYRKTKKDAEGNITGVITGFEELEKTDLKKRVLSALKEGTYLAHFNLLSSEFVGPQVGQRLRDQATKATIFALIGMLVYMAFRFKFIYGVAAVLTLFHDVLVCLSFILFFNIEVSLSVVAAILTIVGYSINDTIVIFDRIRDNIKVMRKEKIDILLDKSINQTLSRTIITSGTVLITVLALVVYGGEVLYGFSFTMLVGVISGSYSTIYQSCAWLKVWQKKFLGVKKTS